MKRILITGKNSYIGRSLEDWLLKYPNDYLVDSISVKDYSWKGKDFSQFDVVFHVAGIAHIKQTKENKELYYKVNRDLAFEIAQKAKLDGVPQFIFLSSMSVYGLDNGIINENTPLRPTSAYGKSKMEAENLISILESSLFNIAILRPPMVYGRGCKGNYPKLASLSVKIPVFPSINNKRSMIYIDNLSEFIRQIVDNRDGGLFFPQNSEYINTSEMVTLIAEVHGKELMMTKIFNPLLSLLNVGRINKVFGNLGYNKNMSKYSGNYEVCNFRESIMRTEK